MLCLSAIKKLVIWLYLAIWMPVLRIFGTIFSTMTLTAMFGALAVGAVFLIYGKGLPGHDELSSYKPKTISRIYSGE